MADTMRESMKPLPKRETIEWKVKQPKGMISQETFNTSRGKKASFQPK